MAVDPNIKKKADDIRNKIYGKEVRESLASGLEAMSEDVVENEGRQSVVEGRQDSVESQWQAVSDEMTDKDVISAPEIIAARNGESNLKARLDKEKNELAAQLAQTAYIAFPIEGEDFGTTIQELYNTIPIGSTLRIAKGAHEFSESLVFDRKIHVIATGAELTYTGSSSVAVQFGQVLSIRVDDFIVNRKTIDWTNDSIGILFKNVNESHITGIGARGFTRGIVIDGDGYGNSYNKYFIKSLWNNKESLVITSSNGGWANENMFFGGRFAWTSDLPSTEGNTHVLIDYVDYSNNNNKFYGCSLENAGDGVGHAIREIGGRANSFYDFRYEGATKIFISSTTHYATISNGYGLVIDNIENNGSGTTIQATNKFIVNKAQPTKFRNIAGATSPILELTNSLDNESMTFYGNGDFSSAGTGYIKKGIELFSIDESQKRSITVYNGDPEGEVTANQGTLIMDRRGYLYIKRRGMETNTGWERVLTEART